MATLWGGRFEKETDQAVFDFNASIGFDKRLVIEDIDGSAAHVKMLEKQKILPEGECETILSGLSELKKEALSGELSIPSSFEDIHSFIESTLVDRIGEAGKRMHTGRSRNDQVALDMRLYTRKRVEETERQLTALLDVVLSLMKEHEQTILPGFTHLQKAQPVNLSHHLGAYFEMFRRDRGRMRDIYARMNVSPLGSGALAGTTFPLDRKYAAELLGFDGITENSMDGVSDRDYLIEFLSALSMIMMHLSRFSEELILWNSDEYRYIEMDDAFSTGSSIMPQKKNPDIAELVRGKTGRVYGALMSLLVTMKGLPLAYNKDMQEDKEGAFDAMDTTSDCLTLFTGMLKTLTVNKDRMRASAAGGFTNATDAADYLVKNGMAFRDAHRVIGEIVLYCIEKQKTIEALSMEEFKGFSELFGEDIYDAVSLETCVDTRLTDGAPGAVQAEIEAYERYMKETESLEKSE